MPIPRDEEEEGEIQEGRRELALNSKRRRGSNSEEIEIQKRRKKSKSKRAAVEEEEEVDGEDNGGGRPFKLIFVDDEASEADDYDEDDEDGDSKLDGFIVDGPENGDEVDDLDGGGAVGRRTGFVMPEEEEDIEEYEKRVMERYGAYGSEEYDDDFDTDIGQRALIPGVKDPKLWLVKCLMGKEREVVVCLMQKSIDKPGELQILSAFCVGNLKEHIYVEAYRESHVREACKGLRHVNAQKIMLVPVKEMANVLSVEGSHVESISVSIDSWVRIRRGNYKGDLGKVVHVGRGNKGQKVTVKLILRLDLQALGRKLKGEESEKNKKRVHPPAQVAPVLFVNFVRQLGLKWVRDRSTGRFEKIPDLPKMLFEDGFVIQHLDMDQISSENITPTLQELENFLELNGSGEHLFQIRKKGERFVKGDVVVVTEGDLINLVGRVHIVEEETVHIRPEMEGLSGTVAIKPKALQKCFIEGQHVKVLSGSQVGATGMVVKVDQQKQLIDILSDATKEVISVFSDHAVKSPEVNNCDRMGDSPRSRVNHQSTPCRVQQFPRGGRGRDVQQDSLGKGCRVKIRLGPYKGCRGRVVEVKGSNVRVELESQMKIVVADRLHCISDTGTVAAVDTTPYCSGSETPMPYMRTPMRDPGASPMPFMRTPIRDPGASPMPYMTTPIRDPRATPVHGGMRSPPIY